MEFGQLPGDILRLSSYLKQKGVMRVHETAFEGCSNLEEITEVEVFPTPFLLRFLKNQTASENPNIDIRTKMENTM